MQIQRFKIFSKVLLVATIFAASCNFLQRDPYDAVPDDGLIKDRFSVLGAINGMYNNLQTENYYGGEFIFMNALLSDDAAHTGSFPTNAQFYANEIIADNITMGRIWQDIYSTIYAANVIIVKTPAVSDDKIPAEEKAQYIAEAIFVRSLCFFDLARLWGNVPIPVDDDVFKNAALGQTSQQQVYEKIVADLQSIEDVLPESYGTTEETKTKATKGAVKALLARVYLYQKDYAKAAVKAGEVIDLGYSLDADYGNVVSPGVYSNEHIFNLYFDANDKNSLAFYFFASPQGRRELAPSSDLKYMFEEEDKRKENVMNTQKGNLCGYKYKDVATGTDQPTILRAAEMYLIRAEALARTGSLTEGATYLNQVRNRAGLESINPGSESEFIDEVLAERMREFCFEPHRFTDLTRTGKADEVLMIVKGEDAWQPTDVLLPIPARELLRNSNLVQNPGY